MSIAPRTAPSAGGIAESEAIVRVLGAAGMRQNLGWKVGISAEGDAFEASTGRGRPCGGPWGSTEGRVRAGAQEERGGRERRAHPEQRFPDGMKTEEDVMKIDPVCGMSVDEKSANWHSEYQGMTYVFCSPGCKKTFDKEPARYAKLSPASGHGHGGH